MGNSAMLWINKPSEHVYQTKYPQNMKSTCLYQIPKGKLRIN